MTNTDLWQHAGAAPASSELSASFHRIRAECEIDLPDCDVAQEMPVAIDSNGFGYAALMASPVGIRNLVYSIPRRERICELPQLNANSGAVTPAIFRALASLPDHWPLYRMTGGVHAAALSSSEENIHLALADLILMPGFQA